MAGKIEGIAMPYGREADICGRVPGKSVDPGAFGTIGDVILNLMHDRREPLARTEGGGLDLERRGRGGCAFAPTFPSIAPT